MKRSIFFALVLSLALPFSASAYKVQYAEQWYKLFHRHLYEYPDDCMENIWYLEQALKSDFANPLNALAKITNEKEWERYRALFTMHVHLLLVQQYLALGKNFDKQNAYFYNYPWKWANLDSLEKAERVYRVAYSYWEEAQTWSAKASELSSVPLDDVQYWMDESWRIENGELDYRAILDRHLQRLENVRQAFKAMGPGTY